MLIYLPVHLTKLIMSSTEIITIAVDSDLINRAKAIAAKLEISIDELLNFELRYLLESLEVTQR